MFHEIVGNYTGNKCTILDEEVESNHISFQPQKLNQCTTVDINWNTEKEL